MEYQKFIPEGWEDNIKPISKEVINKAMQSGDTMQGLVYRCDSNYNLYLNLGNKITGIIPRQEIEDINSDKIDIPKPSICLNKVNKIVQFKVKDITKDDIVILSRKSVCKEAIKWVKTDLKEGMILSGIVKNIRPYGAFVEIGGGVVGLLHIEDISVGRIKNPSERFVIGQKINIMIKSIDRKTNRVILTYKELLGTWEENIQKFKEDSIVKAIARDADKLKNGIFVELAPNLIGLAEYKENIKYGQEVNVIIKKVLPEKKKVKLIIV